MENIPSASPDIFIEIDYFQKKKKGESAAGDVFLSQKNQSGSRIITTLSDGLGKGIKANVLASLTATMISKFVLMDIPPREAAEIILNSLPVCRYRGLAYATFTLVEARHDMRARIIEYDNPPLLILRDNALVTLKKEKIPLQRKRKKTGPQNETLFLSMLNALPGDRVIFFSDGVTQAGMGAPGYPFGWGAGRVQRYIIDAVKANPSISAGALARGVVSAAEAVSAEEPKDDMSCGVIYYRKPRALLVITGPPFHPESDRELARLFTEFTGAKIISGGTSARIIARELGKTISPGEAGEGADVPASSMMEGADLVCEGILTLGAVAEELARDKTAQSAARNPVTRMRDLLLDSDTITFVVGTRINDIHQDPSMPVELEIRRAVVKRIAALLEGTYLKATRTRYI